MVIIFDYVIGVRPQYLQKERRIQIIDQSYDYVLISQLC